MLKMFYEADRVTTEIDPTLIGIKYWMSNEIQATPTGDVLLRSVFDSFLATRAWFTNLLGRKSPSPPIEQLTLADLDRGACIGVLSSIDSQAELQREMEAHFASLDRPLRAVTVRRFGDANLSFALAVLKPVASRGRRSRRRARSECQSGRRATAISDPPRTQDNCLSGASAPNRPAKERIEWSGWDGQRLSDDLDQVVWEVDRMPRRDPALSHLRQERQATEVADVERLESCVPQNSLSGSVDRSDACDRSPRRTSSRGAVPPALSRRHTREASAPSPPVVSHPRRHQGAR